MDEANDCNTIIIDAVKDTQRITEEHDKKIFDKFVWELRERIKPMENQKDLIKILVELTPLGVIKG